MSTTQLRGSHKGQNPCRGLVCRPKSSYDIIPIINMGEFVLYRIETKIKAPSFLNIGDNDLNVCDGMILEMVYKHEVHN